MAINGGKLNIYAEYSKKLSKTVFDVFLAKKNKEDMNFSKLGQKTLT